MIDHESKREPKGDGGIFTFRRNERISNKKDFTAVYSGGKKMVGKRCVLYWRENNLPHHRLGVSVSKKVGGAVVRNRIKRIFRETFRSMRPPVVEGVDFVLVARHRMRDISAGVFIGEYRRLLKAAGFALDMPGDTK